MGKYEGALFDGACQCFLIFSLAPVAAGFLAAGRRRRASKMTAGVLRGVAAEISGFALFYVNGW